MSDRLITFAEAGIAYQIRLSAHDAVIEAVGPGDYTRRATIEIEPDEIDRIVESPHNLAKFIEDRLRRSSLSSQPPEDVTPSD